MREHLIVALLAALSRRPNDGLTMSTAVAYLNHQDLCERRASLSRAAHYHLEALVFLPGLRGERAQPPALTRNHGQDRTEHSTPKVF